MVRFAGTARPCLHTAAGLWLLLTFQILAVRPSASQDILTAPPVLNGGDVEQRATAGYYSLRWRHPANSEHSLDFVVQESANADFDTPEIIYAGRDLATFVSGKRNGVRYYRVRARPGDSAAPDSWSPWSDVLAVTTVHHSRVRAFMFLGLGAFVFVATIALIVVGNRAYPGDGSDRVKAG